MCVLFVLCTSTLCMNLVAWHIVLAEVLRGDLKQTNRSQVIPSALISKSACYCASWPCSTVILFSSALAQTTALVGNYCFPVSHYSELVWSLFIPSISMLLICSQARIQTPLHHSCFVTYALQWCLPFIQVLTIHSQRLHFLVFWTGTIKILTLAVFVSTEEIGNGMESEPV